MSSGAKNSPFAGRAGKFVTTRQVRERLYKELERNVALRVEDTEQPDTFTVSGRGEHEGPGVEGVTDISQTVLVGILLITLLAAFLL